MKSNLTISVSNITAKPAAITAAYMAKPGTLNLVTRLLPASGTDACHQGAETD